MIEQLPAGYAFSVVQTGVTSVRLDAIPHGLLECTYCRRHVPLDAETCPGCGAPA